MVNDTLRRFHAGQPLCNCGGRERRRMLSDADLAALRQIVVQEDTLYLDELRTRLAAVCNKAPSVSTILRALQRLGLNRKKARAPRARAGAAAAGGCGWG